MFVLTGTLQSQIIPCAAADKYTPSDDIELIADLYTDKFESCAMIAFKLPVNGA